MSVTEAILLVRKLLQWNKCYVCQIMQENSKLLFPHSILPVCICCVILLSFAFLPTTTSIATVTLGETGKCNPFLFILTTYPVSKNFFTLLIPLQWFFSGKSLNTKLPYTWLWLSYGFLPVHNSVVVCS